MPLTPAASYRACEAIARREAANFYPAFRLLPRPQRLALCALYAFCRIADDIGDRPAPTSLKRYQLDDWRRGLDQCLQGIFRHPIHPALADTLQTYRVPAQYLHDVLDGVAMDLEPRPFETFAELRLYCYRVASAVGLACIHVWGFSDPKAKLLAEDAGIAFQLTNILRDLKEDAAQNRLYLPHEDLERFGYTFDDLKAGRQNDAFRQLMAFQAERAHAYYLSAWPLADLLPPPGRAVFLVMARTYRALLAAMERRRYDVFSTRIRLSPWRKALLAFRAIPVRLGWLRR